MKPPDPSPALDVLVIGEAIVDFVPLHRGPLRETTGFELHSGGAPANVAIGVSRLGGRAGLVSVVGDDEFGAFLLSSLERERVDIRAVHRQPETDTALCFITLDADGDRSFLQRGGDPARWLGPEHVLPAQVAAARVVKFSTGPLRTAGGLLAVKRVIENATGLVACDPGTCPGHWASPDVIASRLADTLPHCHVVKCSETEAQDITGNADPAAAARALVERGPDLAIVTLGASGAVYARADDGGHVGSPKVEVVDTTGAGDAFMAGLLLRLARDGEAPATMSRARLEQHLAFAATIGAGVVTRRGAINGLPERPPEPSAG